MLPDRALGAHSQKQVARRGLEGATSKRYRAENPDEFERNVQKRLSDSPSVDSYYGQALAGSRFDDSAEVGRISSPTLVIHDSEDRYVPPSNARALAEAIPNARLRILEGAGHLVFVERAAEVNREVITFLSGGEPRVAPSSGVWLRTGGGRKPRSAHDVPRNKERRR